MACKVCNVRSVVICQKILPTLLSGNFEDVPTETHGEGVFISFQITEELCIPKLNLDCTYFHVYKCKPFKWEFS